MESARGFAIGLPEGLGSVPPGPELVAVLASVDRSQVTAEQLPELLLAWHRMESWVQFQHEAVACETARGVLAQAGSTVRCDDTEQVARGVEVVAWTLRCSHRFARDLVDLGAAMTQRLPAVGAAYEAGLLDHGRAHAFADSLRGVADDELARSIADRLLGHAPQQTVGQLRDALRFHMDKRDPLSQRRRYQAGHANRRVWIRQNPEDGTASLCAAGLSPVGAARAFDRLDRIARSARADGDGDPRNLAQLRADAMVDILTGQQFTLHPTIDPATAEADAANPVPDRGHHPPDWRPTRTPGEHPRPGLSELLLTGGSRFATGNSDASRFPTGTTEPPPPPDPDDPDDPDWDDGEPDSGGTDDRPPPPDGPPPPAETNGMDEFEYDRACLTDQDLWWVHSDEVDSFNTGVLNPNVLPGDRCATCQGGIVGIRRGVAEVSLKLTTLLGLDDDPALVAGIGIITAEIARTVALDPRARPTWRWSIFDEDGLLLHHGTTRHRPPTLDDDSRFATGKTGGPVCTCRRYEPSPRKESIELHLTPHTLAAIASQPPPGYEQVIADITEQLKRDRAEHPPGTWTQLGNDGKPLHHGHTTRMPTSPEAAFIRARDRTCRTPSCRRIASRCELDHRLEYANGGPSHRGWVDTRCKRHHHLREHGFTVHKRGRTTIWTTPSGRHFTVPDGEVILTADHWA